MDKAVWKKLRKTLEAQGYTIRLGGGMHYKVYLGKRLVSVMANTASCPRAYRNQLAQLRRAGAIV